MIEMIMKWLQKNWWGVLAAYVIAVAGCYLGIWAGIEPLGIQDKIEPSWLILRERSTYHIVASILLGAHLIIILEVIIRNSIIKNTNAINLLPLPYDSGYSINESKQFYDAIAVQYDQRNSPSLLQTHAEVIQTIKKTILHRSSAEVLDLGGGTGKLIAHHFFDRADIHWVYVDESALMAEQFRKNLENTKLKRTVEVEEINAYINRAPDQLYDVIIVSLVLTSMDKLPDFSHIANRLKDDGRLIVAEIDAAYTTTYPYYIVTCDSHRHALRPRPVPLTQLIHEANKAKLHLDHSHPILEGNLNYAFIVSFRKT